MLAMTRQDLKKCCRNPILICCAVLALISVLLLFPAVRLLLVSAAERFIVRRPLRDTGKWDRLMLRYASVQLLAIVAVAWLHKRTDRVMCIAKAFVREIRLSHIFLLLLILAFVFQNLALIAHPDRTGWYMDCTNLWDHYVCVLGGRSLHLGMYPPLASFIYRLNASMLPEDLFSGDWKTLAYSDGGSYVTLLFYLFSVVPFCLLCFDSIEGKKTEKLVATTALCCSAPFLYSLMRGNIVLFSACAAFCFCRSARSENGFVRAAGLLALFVAIGTKLYPVAFAALLVKERRWKELKACLVMALLLFVFMLTFFDGGMSEIANMMRHITNFTSTFKEHHNLSLKRQVWDILSFCGLAKDTGLFPVLNVAVYVLYIAASGVLFFLTKKRWVELMLLTLACLLVPGIVRPYTEVFLIIPIVELLNSKKKDVFVYLSLVFLLPMLLFVCDLSLFVTFHAGLVTFPLFALCAAEVVRERYCKK